jgi:N-acyl homoserine lactone hydrolase
VWQTEGVELPAERPLPLRIAVDYDAFGVRRAIVHLHTLKQRLAELAIVPAHDARVWARLPKLLSAHGA